MIITYQIIEQRITPFHRSQAAKAVLKIHLFHIGCLMALLSILGFEPKTRGLKVRCSTS